MAAKTRSRKPHALPSTFSSRDSTPACEKPRDISSLVRSEPWRFGPRSHFLSCELQDHQVIASLAVRMPPAGLEPILVESQPIPGKEVLARDDDVDLGGTLSDRVADSLEPQFQRA